MKTTIGICKGILIGLLLGAFIITLPSTALAWTFNIFVVDDGGDGPGGTEVGWETSLAFSPSGSPLGSDLPFISYYDVTSSDLKFAGGGNIPGIGFGNTTVDSAGMVGRYTSLAFDSSGNPAISYFHFANKKLKYASWNSTTSSWDIETVDSADDVGPFTSLAFDSSGNPAISYLDLTNQDLKYAYWNGASWDIDTVDSADIVGSYTSLAFDSSGNPAISYYDVTNLDLKYASWNGDTLIWDIETVDFAGDVGEYTSLAFDSSGNPAISYYDDTNDSLKYAYKAPLFGWQITAVDSGGGRYTSLAFDPETGYPTISYRYLIPDLYPHAVLKFAWWDGVDVKTGFSWQTMIVDSLDDVGFYTSLAFDADGYPAISYYDYTNGQLKLAYDPDPTPTPEPATLVLLGTGLAGLGFVRRRKKIA